MRYHTKRLSILVIACLLVSCSAVGPYKPDAEIATGMVEGVSFSAPLAIINNQPSNEQHTLQFRGIIVNYHEFTQSLVDGLKAEVLRSGGIIDDSSGKELHVSITRISMNKGAFNFQARILAEVAFGADGLEHFNVSRASYGSLFMTQNFPTKPLNAAFKDLVADILQNQKIQSYLNE